ncbi:rod shape-determining protein RodA [Halothiobacillus sp.]|uniref:rod shape-determining protein RodA n=1 Tax=Halothiobacillus sp. TaxID=1891311 RepID=UPI00263762F5|nr:rod shape-determining protein RodA [Halothiobacillus sp.]MDD4965557.1 rod shape-determining protein RodA [Halothiobacillus sp.]
MATEQPKAGISGRGPVLDRLNRSSDFGKHEGAKWFFLGLLSLIRRINYDPVLLFFLMLIAAIGLVAGYSASDQSVIWVEKSAFRFALAFLLMLAIAQVPQRFFFAIAPWLFGFVVVLLVAVHLFGDVGKGAQRWLDLGFIRFQPAEILKLGMPMMLAWFLARRPLPPRFLDVVIALILVAVPTVLIVMQPDLGTAILVMTAGLFVLFFAGLSWWYVLGFVLAISAAAPLMWFYVMHDYQKERVLTLFNPMADPLGAGYHTIQSMIAIGSGGIWGVGWLQGTQSHLNFLPEGTTDFILAVYAEEFGLMGLILLFGLYLAVIWRGLYIAAYAESTAGRMLAAAISMTFLVYVFVNAGMVIGILPVVGVPLPLMSYGGTALVTIMIALGMLMSIRTQRSFLGHER